MVSFDCLQPASVVIEPDLFVRYIRCDANGDGRSNIADAVWILEEIFRGGPESTCRAALDCDDDDAIGVTDALFAIAYRFLGGPVPAAPFPDCGEETLEGAPLDCEVSACD